MILNSTQGMFQLICGNGFGIGFKAEDLPYPFFLCLILPVFKFLILSLNDHLSHPFPYLGSPPRHTFPQNCNVGLVLGLKPKIIRSVFRVFKKWKTFCKLSCPNAWPHTWRLVMGMPIMPLGLMYISKVNVRF